MQCVNCGRPLHPNEAICPNCGEPALYTAERSAARDSTPTWTPTRTDASGSPVDSNAPTLYGLPVGPDRYGRSVAPPPYRPGVPPARGYQPATALPARPAARTVWLRALAALSVFCLLGLLFAGALVASGQSLGDLHLGFGPFHPRPTATTGPTPTPTPACPLPAVDPQAARSLKSIQLATGIRNPYQNPPDLRPLDNVSTFLIGQTPYATFQVATAQPGTIGASFCLNGTNVAGNPLPVPSGYLNARGEFHLPSPLTASNVGPGALVLTWNGAVAAALPFTVRSH